MENDANCFALAEPTIGAEKKYEVYLGYSWDWLGGGVVIIRRFIGCQSIAGEGGHHTLTDGGNVTVVIKVVRILYFRNGIRKRMERINWYIFKSY
ncbi:MAG: hypothetical protein Ct9H300mP18_07850 [Candidatus Neomarinimicrobiota bacterium]|nr:MAG: hypothetical protein Ct9H300mP18_07850 [Candidatus Neomarinimicrobiota bacterium]